VIGVIDPVPALRQRQQQPDGAGTDQERNQEIKQNLLHRSLQDNLRLKDHYNSMA